VTPVQTSSPFRDVALQGGQALHLTSLQRSIGQLSIYFDKTIQLMAKSGWQVGCNLCFHLAQNHHVEGLAQSLGT
jgi:hypothetical protein